MFHDRIYTKRLFEKFYADLRTELGGQRPNLADARNVFLNFLAAVKNVRSESLNKSMLRHYITHFQRRVVDNRQRFSMARDDLEKAEQVVDEIVDTFRQKVEEGPSVTTTESLRVVGALVSLGPPVMEVTPKPFMNKIENSLMMVPAFFPKMKLQPKKRPNPNKVDLKAVAKPIILTTTMRPWYKLVTLPFSGAMRTTPRVKDIVTPRYKTFETRTTAAPAAADRVSVDFMQLPQLEELSFTTKKTAERVFGGVSSNTVPVPETRTQNPRVPSSHVMAKFEQSKEEPARGQQIDRLIETVDKLVGKMGSKDETNSVVLQGMGSSFKAVLMDTIEKGNLKNPIFIYFSFTMLSF